jgi:hypothetical protein
VKEYECKWEEYSEGEGTEEDMLENEEIMNPLDRKLCVLRKEADEVVAENNAIEKVRFAYAH